MFIVGYLVEAIGTIVWTDVTTGFLVVVGGLETGVIITSFMGSTILADFTDVDSGDALNVDIVEAVELADAAAAAAAAIEVSWNMSYNFYHCLFEAALRSAGPYVIAYFAVFYPIKGLRLYDYAPSTEKSPTLLGIISLLACLLFSAELISSGDDESLLGFLTARVGTSM